MTNAYQAISTIVDLPGFISITTYGGVPEVHLTEKGLEIAHTAQGAGTQKLQRDYRPHYEYSYMYYFRIGKVKFFTLSLEEVDFLESIIEDQGSGVPNYH